MLRHLCRESFDPSNLLPLWHRSEGHFVLYTAERGDRICAGHGLRKVPRDIRRPESHCGTLHASALRISKKRIRIGALRYASFQKLRIRYGPKSNRRTVDRAAERTKAALGRERQLERRRPERRGQSGREPDQVECRQPGGFLLPSFFLLAAHEPQHAFEVNAFQAKVPPHFNSALAWACHPFGPQPSMAM